MDKQLARTSKFLSFVLRHNPQEIGLALDENGWADTEELIAKANVHGTPLDLELLKNIVDTNDKKRFAFNDDQSRIRANQGHSIEVDLQLQPQMPPAILFHGTAEKNLESIKKSGLVKGSRQHVHLSIDHETAIKVGQRHGKPVVIEVKAREMHTAEIPFYLSDNGVWLVDAVPVEWLTV